MDNQPDIVKVIEQEGISLRRDGKLFSGKCSFHDDSTPSMKVFPQNNSWYCFGCHVGGDAINFIMRLHGKNFKDACSHLGIELESNQPARKQRVVETFTYTDGVNTYYKDRLEPGKDGRSKEFRQWSMKDGERQFVRGCEPMIYNGHLLDTVKAVIFTEGEKKADLVNSWKIPGVMAVCLDAGSGSPWKVEYTQLFAGKEKVVIIPDNDDPGEKYAAMLEQQLSDTVKVIKIVRLPGLKIKGDVIDWANAGGTKEKFIEIVKNTRKMSAEEQRIENIKQYDGEDAVISSHELADLLHDQTNDNDERSFMSGLSNLDGLIRGFRGGELTVISGKTKSGKTLLAQTFTNNMSDARPLWFTYEVRMRQFIAQLGYPVPLFFAPKKLKQNDTAWIEEKIIEGIIKYECKVVFLDNTHNVLNLAGDNLTHKIDEFVKRTKEIAVTHNIHFFLMHHVMKSSATRIEDLNSDMLRDSSMIAQTADNVFFVWRDEMGAWLKITENRREGVFNKSIRMKKTGFFFEEDPLFSIADSNPKQSRRRRDTED